MILGHLPCMHCARRDFPCLSKLELQEMPNTAETRPRNCLLGVINSGAHLTALCPR